jgi:hypothetical protein
MTFKGQIIFFLSNNISKNKEKNIPSHTGTNSGFLSFFTNCLQFFQKIDFKLYFLVFLHISKSYKSNFIVPIHFVFALLYHILISSKVLNKIKNRNLQRYFLELSEISVKYEQIGQIGANMIEIGQKGKFCNTILYISYSCIYKVIRMIKQVEMVTFKKYENVHRSFTIPDTES